MATETNVKKQIYKIIESLPVERLPDLLRFLNSYSKSLIQKYYDDCQGEAKINIDWV
jgi:hypothetical protein